MNIVSRSFSGELNIPVENVLLRGDLQLPQKAPGIVIFSHGSGSSRKSPRNQAVALALQQRGFGTLLFDLLTEKEDLQYQSRFDIELLTRRLIAVTKWIQHYLPASHHEIGYFGASTGAASALRAASSLPFVRAVVSRGGRPDLAMDILNSVKTPTLLIVGGRDREVLRLNLMAYDSLGGDKKLEIVEGASHLFEEPGTLEQVCSMAGAWFEKYLHRPTVASKRKKKLD